MYLYMYLAGPSLLGGLQSFELAPVVTRRPADQTSAYQVPRPAPWRVMWPALLSRLK
jgi:hypothetical protein